MNRKGIRRQFQGKTRLVNYPIDRLKLLKSTKRHINYSVMRTLSFSLDSEQTAIYVLQNQLTYAMDENRFIQAFQQYKLNAIVISISTTVTNSQMGAPLFYKFHHNTGSIDPRRQNCKIYYPNQGKPIRFKMTGRNLETNTWYDVGEATKLTLKLYLYTEMQANDVTQPFQYQIKFTFNLGLRCPINSYISEVPNEIILGEPKYTVAKVETSKRSKSLDSLKDKNNEGEKKEDKKEIEVKEDGRQLMHDKTPTIALGRLFKNIYPIIVSLGLTQEPLVLSTLSMIENEEANDNNVESVISNIKALVNKVWNNTDKVIQDFLNYKELIHTMNIHNTQVEIQLIYKLIRKNNLDPKFIRQLLERVKLNKLMSE